jgi:penicillin-binding protein 2
LVVVVCLFATLLGRLWYLQGIEAQSLPVRQLAGQGILKVYIPAPRGEIFDRNGALLVGNRIERVVTVERDAVLSDPNLVGRLSALLGMPPAQVTAAVDNPQYSPYQPVPVAEGVSSAVALAVQENQALLGSGVSVQAEPVPYYPYGPLAANILGYVSQITGSEYDQLKNVSCGEAVGPCYQANSQYGQAGVENTFEKYLRGTPGVEELQVDSQGHVLGVVPGSYRPPVPGDDVVLSISLKDQQAAENALAQWLTKARAMVCPDTSLQGYHCRAPAASMVVEDPRNGQILALATNPDYNPKDFIGGISYAKWDAYNNPANHYPLLDRAISTGYATGSTWKLITATATLRYGLRSPYTYYDDTGTYTIGGQVFHDNDNVALGPVNLQEAITESSDTYFYSLGGQFYLQYDAGKHMTGPDPLQGVAAQYGLGDYSGIGLPGEAPGLVPSAQVVAKEHAQYPRAYPDGTWEPGFEVQEAIGQGQDLVTPLQLADAYAAFANGGTLYVPQIVLAITSPGTNGAPGTQVLKHFASQVKNHVTMPSAPDRTAMLQGFLGVTSNPQGTAYGAFAGAGFPLSRFPVGGKTGTAQVELLCTTAKCPAGYVPWPQYKQDTSVFTSFAPAYHPRFVVDAVFEQAGYGASVAAPAVAQEYQTLFGLTHPATTSPSRSSTVLPSAPPASTAPPSITASSTPSTSVSSHPTSVTAGPTTATGRVH